jgi:hypothetical protein
VDFARPEDELLSRERASGLLALNFVVEPGLGVGPILFNCTFGKAKYFGGFRRSHADEETQLHDLGLNGTVSGQPVKRLVDGQEMVLVGRHGDVHVFKIHLLQAAAVTAGQLAPGVVNQEMAHGFGRGGEEMGAIFKSRVVAADQAHPDLMHQGGGLKRVTRCVLGHLIGGEFAQFRIDQWQQFIGGLWVAMLDGFKNAGYVAQSTKAITFSSIMPESTASLYPCIFGSIDGRQRRSTPKMDYSISASGRQDFVIGRELDEILGNIGFKSEDFAARHQIP